MTASNRLPRYLALAYTLLVIYASLNPFTGWRDNGVAPLAFLTAAWPRYWTGFDLLTNVLAYLPLGFLLTLWLTPNAIPTWRRLLVIILATLLGGSLSLGLECLQNWLPSRVPSNVDLACNTLGAALGSILAGRAGRRLSLALTLRCRHLLSHHPLRDRGLVLIALWLLAQASPEILLFGTGDLRHLLPLPTPLAFDAPLFNLIETTVAAANLLAAGLVARTVLTERWTAPLSLAGIIILALAIKSLAAAMFTGPDSALAWATPGARQGLGFGVLALGAGLLLPARLRLLLAGVTLLLASLLVNLTPANPYAPMALSTWQQGHFLNFNGLTRLLASLWPFLALPYLLAQPGATRRF